MPGLPRGWRIALLLLLTVGYSWLFNWSEPTNNPNENVRVYMARAMAEQGSYAIAERSCTSRGVCGDRGPIYDQWGYVNDKALFCTDGRKAPNCTGKLYAAKAPGLAFVAVLPLTLQRGWYRTWHWGTPSKAAVIWWLRLTCAILPSILGFFWLAVHLSQRLQRPQLAIAVVLAAGLGSLSLTYGQMFAGHQPAAMALLLAYGAIHHAGPLGRRPSVALAGFGVALAACIEFPAAPAGVILVLWLLLRRRQFHDLPWLILGALLPTLWLLHLNWRAFGAPWHLPYAYMENPGFVRDIGPGIFGIALPNLEKTWGSLLSPFTGLYFWAPWVALAWLGFVGLRRPPVPSHWALDRRGDALVASLICLYFLFFQCSHALWRGGWVIGPRYITAIVPFAAIAVAHGLDALPERGNRVAMTVLAVLAPVAIVVTGLGSAVSQGFPFELYNPLPEAVGPLLQAGFVAQNPLMKLGIAGPWSALPYWLALTAACIWLVWLLQPSGLHLKPLPIRIVATVAMLSIAAIGVIGLWSVGPGRTAVTDKTLHFLMTVWTPKAPPGATIPSDLPPL